MAVVGGGLTGIEAATEIAESRPDLGVALAIHGGLGDWLSAKGHAHLRTVIGRPARAAALLPAVRLARA